MGLKLCVSGKKLISTAAKAVLIKREQPRDDWLTAFAMLRDLIQPLISEEISTQVLCPVKEVQIFLPARNLREALNFPFSVSDTNCSLRPCKE